MTLSSCGELAEHQAANLIDIGKRFSGSLRATHSHGLLGGTEEVEDRSLLADRRPPLLYRASPAIHLHRLHYRFASSGRFTSVCGELAESVPSPPRDPKWPRTPLVDIMT